MKKIDKSSEFYGEPMEFKEIDGWLWIKTDRTHMERLPYEEYRLGKLIIKIKGSLTKYLRGKMPKSGGN